MDETRQFTEEELEHIELFLEYSKSIVGFTLKTPMRVSHSIGDLTLHLYIESNTFKKKIETK